MTDKDRGHIRLVEPEVADVTEDVDALVNRKTVGKMLNVSDAWITEMETAEGNPLGVVYLSPRAPRYRMRCIKDFIADRERVTRGILERKRARENGKKTEEKKKTAQR